MKQRRNQPAKFGNILKKPSKKGMHKMSSENTRTVDLTVSRQSIVDKYAEWLAVTKIVLPNEDVKDIQFGELFGSSSDQELVPIKVTIQSSKEVLN